MCPHITSLQTRSHFLILMHPMERQKVKNNTGFITHQALAQSTLLEGINFDQSRAFQDLLERYLGRTYLLYPSQDAQSVSQSNFVNDDERLFILIDATWPCAKKVLRLTTKLHPLPKICFKGLYRSEYAVKIQPKDNYLSTLECSYYLLRELSACALEDFSTQDLEALMVPFRKMNEYQLNCQNDPNRPTYPSRKK